MGNYILKHKDIDVALLDIDQEDGNINRVQILEKKHLPFLGNANAQQIRFWWNHRAMPVGRLGQDAYYADLGIDNPGQYLLKSMGLSLCDHYWMCPEEADLHWEEVSLFHNESQQIIFTDRSGFSYIADPDASLGGNMPKYWKKENGIWTIWKKAETTGGLQCINEKFASTMIHERLGCADEMYVRYDLVTQANDEGEDDHWCCCDSFATEELEFISAYEIASSEKKSNSQSGYEQYIEICEKHGIGAEVIRDFMDYQTLTDFVITNTDRHFNNFGVLRDPDTLRFVCPAPVFDSGNSMFFRDLYIMDRAEILENNITSFYNREDKMLNCIRHRDIIDPDLLPSGFEVFKFYLDHGVSESKASIIAHNYNVKREMSHEFSHGHTISLYNEKERKKKQIDKNSDQDDHTMEHERTVDFPRSACDLACMIRLAKIKDRDHVYDQLVKSGGIRLLRN